MGGKLSTSYEYDDIMENYDALHKIRQEVFSENHTREQWQKILKDFEPSQVYSQDNGFKIYVGGMNHALDVDMLRRIGITNIVNMAGRSVNTSQEFYGDDFNCLILMAEDIEEYDLSQHFTEVSEFLEVAEKEGGSVLVHCVAGVSRSVTVTVAYLMKCQKMGFKEAAKLVHGSRIQAFPNVKFIQNLLELDKELRIKRQKQS